MTFAMSAPRIDRLLNDRDAVRRRIKIMTFRYFDSGDEARINELRRAEAELRLINAELEDEGIFA